MFHNAKWIGSQSTDTDRSLYFRHEFEAVGRIARYPFHRRTQTRRLQNQRTKSDRRGSHPPFTRYDKRYVYREYDVTDLLCVGKNAIGVHVGNGFYTVKIPSRAEIIFGDNTYKLEVGTYRFKDGQMLSE